MKKNKVLFLQGNEVCARAAMYAGVSFYAGYPITPSTEVAEVLAELMPPEGKPYIQMEDEISSMCAIIGASLTGNKVMTATSGPGFSLMQEAIGYGHMAEIPCVIVNVQRGGPSTGMPTSASQADVMQTKWGTHGDHSVIVLTASNHEDIFAMTVEAFNFSELYRMPVVLLLDEVIAHMREGIEIPEPGELPITERLNTSVPADSDYHPYFAREDGRLPMSEFGGVHRYNVTGLVHDMWGFPSNNSETANTLIHHLVNKVENYKNDIARYKLRNMDDAEIVLISYGCSARSAKQTMNNLRQRRLKVGLIELQTLWPFPDDIIYDLCKDARYIVVAEMNMGQVIHQVKEAVSNPDRVFLANRVDGALINPEDIENVVNLLRGKGK